MLTGIFQLAEAVGIPANLRVSRLSQTMFISVMREQFILA